MARSKNTGYNGKNVKTNNDQHTKKSDNKITKSEGGPAKPRKNVKVGSN